MWNWIVGTMSLSRWSLLALLAIAGFAGNVLSLFVLALCRVLAEKGHETYWEKIGREAAERDIKRSYEEQEDRDGR